MVFGSLFGRLTLWRHIKGIYTFSALSGFSLYVSRQLVPSLTIAIERDSRVSGCDVYTKNIPILFLTFLLMFFHFFILPLLLYVSSYILECCDLCLMPSHSYTLLFLSVCVMVLRGCFWDSCLLSLQWLSLCSLLFSLLLIFILSLPLSSHVFQVLGFWDRTLDTLLLSLLQLSLLSPSSDASCVLAEHARVCDAPAANLSSSLPIKRQPSLAAWRWDWAWLHACSICLAIVKSRQKQQIAIYIWQRFSLW